MSAKLWTGVYSELNISLSAAEKVGSFCDSPPPHLLVCEEPANWLAPHRHQDFTKKVPCRGEIFAKEMLLWVSVFAVTYGSFDGEIKFCRFWSVRHAFSFRAQIILVLQEFVVPKLPMWLVSSVIFRYLDSLTGIFCLFHSFALGI